MRLIASSSDRRSPSLYWIAVLVIGLFWAGCGQQNEYLAEGKDLLKSDKRNRIALAVEQFKLALDSDLTPKEKAEVYYLLAYYDEAYSLEERVDAFTKAVSLAPRHYEEALIYEALRDKDDTIREAVRLAIANRYKVEPRRIRRELLKALEGKDNRDRNDAAWVLGYLAADDPSLIPDIRRALDHKRFQTRLNAVIAVEELAKRDPKAAEQLVPKLMEKIEARPKRVWWKIWKREGERERPEVRVMAVSVLGTIGATDRLLAILSNKGSSLRTDAMKALIASGQSEGVIDVLLGLLEERSPGVERWNSSQSQGRQIVKIR